MPKWFVGIAGVPDPQSFPDKQCVGEHTESARVGHVGPVVTYNPVVVLFKSTGGQCVAVFVDFSLVVCYVSVFVMREYPLEKFGILWGDLYLFSFFREYDFIAVPFQKDGIKQ